MGGGAIILAASLALGVSAAAGDGPLPAREPDLAPVGSEAEPMPMPQPLAPPAEATAEERPLLPPPPPGTWMDVSQEAVSRGIFEVAEWFDRFFTDDRRLEIGRSESFLSLQGALRLSSTGRVTPGYAIRASASMPRLTSWLGRLRLVVSGAAAETRTPALTDPGSAPRAPGQISPQAFVELRYDLIRAERVVVDLGSGVIFGSPPGVFGRLRLRYMVPLWEGALVRLTPAGFWLSGETGLGTTIQVDLEQQIGSADRLRISDAIGITHASAGWEGGAEVAYYHAFTRRSALTANASWVAATYPYPYGRLFRVAVRLRQDFWRKWLFFELEPEVLWPRDPGLPVRREEGIYLRLEIHFDSTSFAQD